MMQTLLRFSALSCTLLASCGGLLLVVRSVGLFGSFARFTTHAQHLTSRHATASSLPITLLRGPYTQPAHSPTPTLLHFSPHLLSHCATPLHHLLNYHSAQLFTLRVSYATTSPFHRSHAALRIALLHHDVHHLY